MSSVFEDPIRKCLRQAQQHDDALSGAMANCDPRLPDFGARLDRALAAVAAIHQALTQARALVARRDGLARAVHGDPRRQG